ncbi:MAG: hypothetical protein FWH37_09920 [Candidatus Bathyarchaeota archaeon]|nr:hypothetical protein [Candidatus Termiticorpusculum sp.]
MKEFFYLDQDLLNSYISQIFNGLLEKVIDENSNRRSTTKENDRNTTETTISGSIGLSKLSFVNALLNGTLKTKNKDGQQLASISDEFKTIIAKKMTDNLFDDFEKYLYSKKLIHDCKSHEEIIEKLKKCPKTYFRIAEDFHFLNLDRID